MGMDLIGYMVKGPVTLPKKDSKKVQRFLKRAKDGQNALAVLNSVQNDNHDEWCTAVEQLVRRYGFFLDDGGDSYETSLALLVTLDLPVLYDDLVAVWERGDARDVVSRNDPDARRQQWLFAGTGSWGDEPDGYAYQTMKKALMAGFWDLCNIR